MNDYDIGDPAMLMRYTLQVGVTMGSALFTFDGFFLRLSLPQMPA